MSRTSPPGAYALVTIATALWGLVITAVALAVLLHLARRDSTVPSGAFDFSEVFEILAWRVLVVGVLLVPLGVAARLGSDLARIFASLVLAILALGSLSLVPGLPLLLVVPVCSVVAIVVLLGRPARDFCSNVRFDRRDRAARQDRRDPPEAR